MVRSLSAHFFSPSLYIFASNPHPHPNPHPNPNRHPNPNPNPNRHPNRHPNPNQGELLDMLGFSAFDLLGTLLPRRKEVCSVVIPRVP